MQGTEFNLDTVLNSKIYMRENSAVSFGSPRQYIEPFLEKMQNTGATFHVNVAEIVANKDQEGDKTNEAYGRVAVVAKFPNAFCAKDHDTNIGLVYALDTQKPTIRIYSGQNAWACTNLAIFGARYVHSVEILQGHQSVYEKSLEYIDGLTKQLARFQEIYERMNDKIYQGQEINTIVGYLVRESYKNKEIGTSAIISAIHDLEDNKSKYAIREDKTSQWNIYSAVTNYVTDKVDIFNKPSKTAVISNLFVNE